MKLTKQEQEIFDRIVTAVSSGNKGFSVPNDFNYKLIDAAIEQGKEAMQTTKKTPQEKAAELLPFVQALANGDPVTQSVDGGVELACNGSFVYGLTYAIKPKFIYVNGFKVPEPMRVAPEIGSLFFVPEIANEGRPAQFEWRGDHFNLQWLSIGICFSTSQAAITYAKAILGLGINPNGAE